MNITQSEREGASLAPSVSVIIPAYNEAAAIGRVIERLKRYVDGFGFEVIVVNDASSDDTAAIVSNHKYIKLISHPYNKGYGAALKTGVKAATGDYILTMDGDGQHRTRDISKLMEHINEYDMVVGSRKDNNTQEWIRKPGKLVLSKVANYLSGVKIPDINSGFRLIRKDYVNEFKHILPNGFSFSTTITLAIIKAGYDVKFVPIRLGRRRAGKSSVQQGRDGVITLLLITRCISLFNPLKVYIPVALTITFLSTLFALYGIIVYDSFPKTAILGILIGVLIAFFGILSDQIAAIRREIH